MHFRILLLNVLLISGSIYASPQNGYPHTPIRISEENGLSSNPVNCIHQSPDGLIWFGTRNGLTRYDGNRCSVFFPDEGINAICSDSDGNLYVGTDKNLFRIHEGRTDTLHIAGTNSYFQHVSALAETDNKIHLAFRARRTGKTILRSGMELSEEQISSGYFYWEENDLRHGPFFVYTAFLPEKDQIRFFKKRDGSMLFGGWTVNSGQPIRNFDSENLQKNSFTHITGYTETPEGDIFYTELTEPHLYRYSASSGETSIEKTFDFTPQISLQGKDDVIYIGHRNGLIRYHYRSGNQVTLLSDESINELMSDSDSNLWVGTDNGVILFSYIKSGISFEETVPEPSPSPAPLSELWGSDDTTFTINDSFTDLDGRIWASTTNSGLICFDRKTGILYPDTYCIRNHPATSISYFNRKRETIFTCRHFRYDRFDLKEKRWHYYAPDIDDPRIDFVHAERIGLTPDEFISKDIVYMEDDANWLVTDSRLVRHDLKDNSVTTILTYHTDDRGYSTAVAYPSHTNAEQMEGKGYFYIGAENILYRVDVASRKYTVIYRQDKKSAISIPPLHLAGRIFETGNGKLIFGSEWYSDGLFILDPATKEITTPGSVSAKKKKLQHNIIEDPQGNILLYLPNPARLCAFDPDTWKEQYSIPTGAVSYLLPEDTTLWICGSLKPLIRYDTGDSTDVTYMYDAADPSALAAKNVMKIIPLKDSLYLLEGRTHLILFDRNNQTFDNTYFTEPMSLNSLGTCICCDASGRIWYGSRDGLSIIDRKAHSVRTYLSDIHFPDNISDAWIHDITKDSRGNIWVGTRNNLYRYDALKDSLLPLPSLSGKEILNITEDAHSRLWIATSNGLFCKLSPDSDSLRKFPSYLGLKGNSFDTRSIKNPDGRISFSGTSGWTTFHPDSLNSHTKAAPIIITDFMIDGKNAQERLSDRMLDLPYSQNSLSFYFSCSDYVFNRYLDYRYRILGVDEDWIYTKAPFQYANYAKIPPGRHILEIEVTNRFGEWDEGSRFSLPIRIRHPFWCQWWSLVLYLVLLHLLLGFYANFREKKHLIEKTRLERMVSERTSDLKREMNLKNKFFSILSHDLKSPINGAAFTTDVFLRQYDQIPEEQRKEMLEVLHLSLMSSSDMLNSIMLWRQSQSTDIEPNYQKINLKETCRQVADMHSAAYHRKNVSLDIDIPDDMFVMTDKNILSTILRNLLGNALKYSYHNGRVRLFCTGREDKVYVSVQDFGTGMDEHTRNSLFRMDETCRRKGTDSESGSGLGLLIISEFLKKMGESIKIESEPEKGSIFTFTLRNLHQESY